MQTDGGTKPVNRGVIIVVAEMGVFRVMATASASHQNMEHIAMKTVQLTAKIIHAIKNLVAVYMGANITNMEHIVKITVL